MFSEEQLANIDGNYFNIICADGLDVTIQSKNTRHWWYLHSTGCVGENTCIIFHKHKYNHPYHQHGRTRTLETALKKVKQHDKWQMNGRKCVNDNAAFLAAKINKNLTKGSECCKIYTEVEVCLN